MDIATSDRSRTELLHDVIENRTCIQLKDLTLDGRSRNRNQETFCHEAAGKSRRPRNRQWTCDVLCLLVLQHSLCGCVVCDCCAR